MVLSCSPFLFVILDMFSFRMMPSSLLMSSILDQGL